MSLELFLAFVLASTLLALTPGPAMSLILANAAGQGARAGLLTVSGNSIGLALLVAIATYGMTSVMVLMAEWFDWIRFAGAAYLVWLGIGKIRQALAGESVSSTRGDNRTTYFWQGFGVALSNPKVLLFLGAFLPQFVDAGMAPLPQYTLLAVTFVATLTLIDSGFALFASQARTWTTGRLGRSVDAATGGLLIAGGLLLTFRRG